MRGTKCGSLSIQLPNPVLLKNTPTSVVTGRSVSPCDQFGNPILRAPNTGTKKSTRKVLQLASLSGELAITSHLDYPTFHMLWYSRVPSHAGFRISTGCHKVLRPGSDKTRLRQNLSEVYGVRKYLLQTPVRYLFGMLHDYPLI